MDSIKDQISKNFSKQVETYAQWAHAQKYAAQELVKNITVRKNGSVLDVGCGNGFLIEALLQKEPTLSITGIDIAPGCIVSCKNRWSKHTFMVADAETFRIAKRFDLIVSGFTFQWFQHFETALGAFLTLLKKNGVLAFNIPIHGSLKELKTTGLRLHDFPTKEKLIDIIQKNSNNFSYFTKTHTHYYTTPLEAVRSIKNIGANYTQGDFAYTESKRSLEALKALQTAKGFPLSYEILFVTLKADV